MINALISSLENLGDMLTEAAAKGGAGAVEKEGTDASSSFTSNPLFKIALPLFCLRAGTICGLDQWLGNKKNEEEMDDRALLKNLFFRSMRGGELFEKLYEGYEKLFPNKEGVETTPQPTPNWLKSLGLYLLEEQVKETGEKLFQMIEKFSKGLPPTPSAPAPGSRPIPPKASAPSSAPLPKRRPAPSSNLP